MPNNHRNQHTIDQYEKIPDIGDLVTFKAEKMISSLKNQCRGQEQIT